MIDEIMEFVTEYHVLRWGVGAFVALIIVSSFRSIFPNCKIFKK